MEDRVLQDVAKVQAAARADGHSGLGDRCVFAERRERASSPDSDGCRSHSVPPLRAIQSTVGRSSWMAQNNNVRAGLAVSACVWAPDDTAPAELARAASARGALGDVSLASVLARRAACSQEPR